ncbi:MAG: mechanosensitive ion channel [Phycisphaerae bacterium]|nr:mechanosensitive ion channel [Phycisphaerae bacterium]
MGFCGALSFWALGAAGAEAKRPFVGTELMDRIVANYELLVWTSISLLAVVVLTLVVHYLLFKILGLLARRTEGRTDESFVVHLRAPMRWILVIAAVRLAAPLTMLPPAFLDTFKHLFALAMIALVSWLIIRAMRVLDDFVLERFDIGARDNLRARKVHTQLKVLRRVVAIAVLIIALGTALMTFDKVRQLGTTILASAGLLGLVVGMAAQKTLSNLIAGLQIAFTQPIRVDDVVIVEGEWGRIEEITLTYVVVRIWDLRRLIVPITYFIEQPFQNWTRTCADILATVFIYADHTIPVDAVRAELRRLLELSEHWDRKVCVLQVTNTTERTVELRALMSTADASTAWELRCEIREKLVAFIRDTYPESLPKFRAELDRAASAGE